MIGCTDARKALILMCTLSPGADAERGKRRCASWKGPSSGVSGGWRVDPHLGSHPTAVRRPRERNPRRASRGWTVILKSKLTGRPCAVAALMMRRRTAGLSSTRRNLSRKTAQPREVGFLQLRNISANNVALAAIEGTPEASAGAIPAKLSIEGVRQAIHARQRRHRVAEGLRLSP